jgi:hypothetical protein
MIDFGRFDVKAALQVEPADPALGGNLPMTPWVWWPSAQLAAELPTGLCLALGCAQTSDHRVFYPLPGPNGDGMDFVARAWVGGLAITRLSGGLSRHQLFSHEVMWVLYQKIRRTHDLLRRDFGGCNDILLTPGGVDDLLIDDVHRFLANTSKRKPTIIPGFFRKLGSSGAGGAERSDVKRNCLPTSGNLSLGELLVLGHQAATAQGVSPCSTAAAVRFGLVEVARQATHVPTGNDARRLIHRALFRTDFDPQELEACLDHPLTGRILAAVEVHKDDDDQHFDEWFWGGKNGFVKQIVKPQTTYTREDVKRLLAALGCRALEFVGQCTHTLMSALRSLIDPPLDDCENAIFSQMYLPQGYLGQLPALLLIDRWPFLSPILKSIWAHPGNTAEVAVLHRALLLYSELAEQRRAADRTRKRRAR